MYVTLEEAKRQCNVDIDIDDVEITALIEVAEEAVSADLQRDLSELVVDGKLKRAVWQAIRIRIADLYANRESVTTSSVNIMPQSYWSLILPHRAIK